MQSDRRKFMKSLMLSPLLLFMPNDKDKYDYHDKIISNSTIHIDAPGVVLRVESICNSIFYSSHLVQLKHPNED